MISRLIWLDEPAHRDTIFLLWYQLGELLRKVVGAPQRALWAYREALKLHPQNPQLLALVQRLTA